jgi:hypothetical protein
MTLPERMVEAAAIARAKEGGMPDWNALMDHEQARYRAEAGTSLRAALALAEAAVRDAMQAPLPAGKHTTTGGVVFVPLLAWAAVDAALAQEAGDAT